MRILFLTLAVLLIAGCASAPVANRGPKWTDACHYAAPEGTICGLGIAKMSSTSLARSTATARARTELMRALQTKVEAMHKDYQAETGTSTSASAEQDVVDVSRQVTTGTISGSRVEESWTSDGGETFVMVVLSVDDFKKSVMGMKALNEEVRKAIVARSDKAFSELDAAIGK